jgi:hypothetical protein
MKTEKELTESEKEEICNILNTNGLTLTNTVNQIVEEHVVRCNEQIKEKNLEILGHKPANADYFKAVILSELFAQLHNGNKEVAETTIFNLRGQAGI